MRAFVLILCLVTAASAAPVEIVEYINDNDGTGQYRFLYVLSDGTRREEIGELVNRGLQNEHISVRGYYVFLTPDAVQHTVKYKADEGGYQPEVEEGPGLPPALTALALG